MEVGIFVAKYSYEFKKKVVCEYIQGEGGYKYLSKKYGVKSTRDIRKWVNAYKEFGDKCVLKKTKHTLLILNSMW